MSGITLKRAAKVLRIVSFPLSVRPTGSGPRASQNVASSVKCETMRSTSRLLKAAEIGRASCRERVWISVVAVSLKKKNERREQKKKRKEMVQEINGEQVIKSIYK